MEMTMHTSGLWWYYDSRPRRDTEIGKAVRRYRQKYGLSPTHIWFHPSALEKKEPSISGLWVGEDPTILRLHFVLTTEANTNVSKDR